VEQTVSRFLPNVLTYRALKKLNLTDEKLAAALPPLVKKGLDRLYLYQHEDGGWGWWEKDESSPYISAYVVFAMLKAQESDFEVKPDSLQRGLQFLQGRLAGGDEIKDTFAANRQAWLLYVLAEAKQAPESSLVELFDNRDKLSQYARAYLALAMQLQMNDATRVKTLLADFNSAMIMSATGAHWEEAEDDWWAMNTNTRSTAIILDALVRLDGDNKLIPNVVRWLMVSRQEGVWHSTQETAWALIALTDWMEHTGELGARYDYTVYLNDKRVGGEAVTQENIGQSEQVQIAVADLLKSEANRLVLAHGEGDGRLYYTAHLKVYLPVEEIKAVNRGVIVQRRYSLASCTDGPKCPEVKEAKIGDVIRVDLTLIAPHDLHYLVVEDMLPAGAEGVDTGLATTSLLAMDPQLMRRIRPDEEGGYPWARWWRWYSRSEMRDEKVVLFANFMPRGTYEYSYTMRATTAGAFHVIPTVASEFYFPEVFGRSDGRMLFIGEAQ
jgi:alpha-2-macroglobulin